MVNVGNILFSQSDVIAPYRNILLTRVSMAFCLFHQKERLPLNSFFPFIEPTMGSNCSDPFLLSLPSQPSCPLLWMNPQHQWKPMFLLYWANRVWLVTGGMGRVEVSGGRGGCDSKFPPRANPSSYSFPASHHHLYRWCGVMPTAGTAAVRVPMPVPARFVIPLRLFVAASVCGWLFATK